MSYPVIFLSLKGIRGLDWESSQSQLNRDLSELFQCYDYLRESEKLNAQSKRAFCQILDSAPDAAYEDALSLLGRLLHSHYGQRVILLIDEYDAPLQRAYQNGFYQPMAAFMQRFLDVLKSSDHLHKAVLTGCLRIARESLFSTLNNFVVHTVQEPSPFDQYFGFTQEEVDLILADAGMGEEHRDTVRQWYDGYRFGETTIYNPWSVLNYVAEGGREAKDYWMNTSENYLLYQRLEEANLGLQRDLETLLEGKTIEREVRDSITFREMGQLKEDVWSILVHTGNLNAETLQSTPLGHLCRLRIPNYEVAAAFAGFVHYLIPEFDYQLQRTVFHALRDGETKKLSAALTELVQFLSYHDKVAKQPEAAFHAFVLGLFVIGRNLYEITSNSESGSGRADLLMRPRAHSSAAGEKLPRIVIEFKTLKKDEAVEAALDEALEQIRESNYTANLTKAGIEQIRCYAIVLQGKQVSVRLGKGVKNG